MRRPELLGRLTMGATLVALAVTPACLRREVSTVDTETKLVYANVVPQPAIDKLDLVVLVDNSASMADKQTILADAVPDLLRGLVQPKCVDKNTGAETGVRSDPTKPEKEQCPAGTEPAFTPITDMHVGVLTSSLGGFGAKRRNGNPQCGLPDYKNADDQGHLVARTEAGAKIAEAGDLGFLAWYPDVPKNQDKERHPAPPVPAIGSLDKLGTTFRDMIVGVGQNGCGLEAQLESVYHFLAQPDPWTQMAVDASGKATYGPKSEVDVALLKQRAAFLRPDSLVAVIMLTDEDDSSPDPLAFDGQGYLFDGEAPLPRATAACESDPASPACTSCSAVASDPACGTKLYKDEEDDPNVRFVNMKRRFGVDPQFPIARYVNALTESKVPSREKEHEKGRYVGKADCTNPIFAASLPTEPGAELCKLKSGPRSKDNVLFALIGGVPNKLLEKGEKEILDWKKILGRAPERWDQTDIDPHMLQSTSPRPGLPGPGASIDADPVHGREWTTSGHDLQYACSFPIVAPGPDGKMRPAPRKCGARESCDCDGTKDSPLCNPADKTVQVRAKAYPTRRPLMVAKELGDRAVVASLCPRQLDAPDADDYGYRPAARAIVDRLARALVGACLPRPLQTTPGDDVPCLVLAELDRKGTQDDCKQLGLEKPADAVLAQYRERRKDEDGEDVSGSPVCEVPFREVPQGQTCKDDDELGYCAVKDAPRMQCSDALVFTRGMARFPNARFTMQCVQVAQAAGAPR